MTTSTPAPAAVTPYSQSRLFAYFLRLGALGFGGPIALAGHMQKDLVERRGWIEQKDYDEGLALAQLSPGPLAAQLATYLGWVKGGVLGAALVSVAFVAPSFLMVVALAALYVRYDGLSWMQGAFYGVGAAVIAIIAKSSVALAKKTLKQDRLLWAIALANAAVTAVTESELVAVVVAGGLFALLVRGRSTPKSAAAFPIPWLVTGLHGAAAPATLGAILGYFAAAGIFVFGSGLAIVPFLHGGVVVDHQWLTERQFLDAVAVAMITPGPVVITVGFIGHLVAGPVGALLAAIGVFVPCFLIVVIAAPYYRRLTSNAKLRVFLAGITAGAVGAIGGAVIVLGRRSIVDLPTAAIALVTLLILIRTKRVPEPVLILIAAAVGIGLRGSAP